MHLFASFERQVLGAYSSLRTVGLGLGLLALLGCPQDVQPLLEDGGRTGADATTGFDAGPGPDGGVSLDSGDTSDAGGPTDAGSPGGFRWSQMLLPPATQTITALWGRGANDVFAGTVSGSLLHFDGAAWTEIWDVPNNGPVRAIHGTADQLFIAGNRKLWVFLGATGNAPVGHVVGNDIKALHVLSNDSVYLLSLGTSTRGLFHYNGTDILEVVANVEAASLNSIWAEPGPKVWIGANGRIPYLVGAGISEAPVAWPVSWSSSDIANFFILSITGYNGHRLGVGSRGGILTDVDGTWRFERPAMTREGDFQAVANIPGGTDPSAIAVGESLNDSVIYWRTPRGWEPDPYTGGRLDLWAAWAATPNQVFAAGSRLSTFDGVLLQGVR